MQNIEIRNQYIGKIQKQINKLIHSVQLLNNLNNVITSQYGGSNDLQTVNTDSSNAAESLAKAKALETQVNVKHQDVDVTRVSNAADKSMDDLNATISILTSFVEELKEKLRSAADPKEKDELNKKIEELNNEIVNLKKKLEEKEKELEDIKKKTEQFEKTLTEYNEILERLRKELPEVRNSNIENYNRSIEQLKDKLSNPDKLIANLNNQPEKIRPKLKSKFEEIFTSDIKTKMTQLVKDADKLRLTQGPLVNGIQIGIKPHTPKNEAEETAINELVTAANTKLTDFTNTNKDLINKINNFITEYNRALTAMNVQSLTETLKDNFRTFNKYFNITEQDVKK